MNIDRIYEELCYLNNRAREYRMRPDECKGSIPWMMRQMIEEMRRLNANVERLTERLAPKATIGCGDPNDEFDV